MLEMRPDCERCGADLLADVPGAFICSFECTFCAECADQLDDVVAERDLVHELRQVGLTRIESQTVGAGHAGRVGRAGLARAIGAGAVGAGLAAGLALFHGVATSATAKPSPSVLALVSM